MTAEPAIPQIPDAGTACFPKSRRLLTKAEFDRVYQQKQRAGDGVLLLFGAPNQQPHTRIGLSVSRKVGPAVVRNRLKRWLREAFRLSPSNLPVGWDLIAIPTDVGRASLQSYTVSLRKLSQKLARRRAEPLPPVPATGSGEPS